MKIVCFRAEPIKNFIYQKFYLSKNLFIQKFIYQKFYLSKILFIKNFIYQKFYSSKILFIKNFIYQKFYFSKKQHSTIMLSVVMVSVVLDLLLC
jgi:hypothetical protein